MVIFTKFKDSDFNKKDKKLRNQYLGAKNLASKYRFQYERYNNDNKLHNTNQ